MTVRLDITPEERAALTPEGLLAMKRERYRRQLLCKKARRRIPQIVARDGWVCGICQQPVSPDAVQVDHILALEYGGGEELENLRFAHRSCNQRAFKDARAARQSLHSS